MLKSLQMKLVLILMLLVVTVMSVVGVFLVNSVTAYNRSDFQRQMVDFFALRGEELDKGLSACNGDLDQMEKVLEAWLYRKRGGQGIPLQLSQFSHLTPDAKGEAAETLSAALRRALPREARWISPKRMMHAISDAGKVTRLVYSPSGSRYEFMRKVENLLHYPMLITNHMIPLTWEGDPDNAGHKPWRNPDAPDDVRTESMEDLIGVATARTVRYMQAALDYWAGARRLGEVVQVVGNLSYGNGLPCQG